MQKTKIRRDKYGLYFRAGGYLFRPIPTKWTKSMGIGNKPSKFTEGQEVKAKHIGGTPTGKVKETDSDYSEIWASHGCYFEWDDINKKNVILPSESLIVCNAIQRRFKTDPEVTARIEECLYTLTNDLEYESHFEYGWEDTPLDHITAKVQDMLADCMLPEPKDNEEDDDE